MIKPDILIQIMLNLCNLERGKSLWYQGYLSKNILDVYLLV